MKKWISVALCLLLLINLALPVFAEPEPSPQPGETPAAQSAPAAPTPAPEEEPEAAAPTPVLETEPEQAAAPTLAPQAEPGQAGSYAGPTQADTAAANDGNEVYIIFTPTNASSKVLGLKKGDTLTGTLAFSLDYEGKEPYEIEGELTPWVNNYSDYVDTPYGQLDKYIQASYDAATKQVTFTVIQDIPLKPGVVCALTSFTLLNLKLPDGYRIVNSFFYLRDSNTVGCLEHAESTVYNPVLSCLLGSLSYAAYNPDKIDMMLSDLGFSWEQRQRYVEPFITFNLAIKQLEDGSYLTLIVVRGTQGASEWISNLDLRLDRAYRHQGFADAADVILKQLMQFLAQQTGTEDISNIKFILTGHSRGAAVANILAHELTLKTQQSNVCAYTFACPDVAVLNWDKQEADQNIFNINNVPDLVPLIPRVLLEMPLIKEFFWEDGLRKLFGRTWEKYGHSYWTTEDGIVPEYSTLNLNAHDMKCYYNFLRKFVPLSSYKIRKELRWDWGGVVLGVFCPVNVTLNDSTGTPIVSIIDGQVDYHDSELGQVIVLTNEDRKLIFVAGTEPFTVDMTATDEGTMDYLVTAVESAESGVAEVVSEKVFQGVELSIDKRMESVIDVETFSEETTDVSNVSLFVLNEQGEFEKEVVIQPDGTTTERLTENTIIPLPDSGYKIGDGMLYGVQPNTLPAALRKNLANTMDVVTMSANGQPHNDAKAVGTGSILGLGSDGSIGRVTVVVRGDVTGDGDVKVQDVIAVRQQILNIKPLEGAYLQASLIKSKDEPKVLDVIEMRKFILQIIDTLG